MSFGWENDQLLWSKETEKHYYGKFSFSVVEANRVTHEDYSQVVSRKNTTYVGIYDGHGGPDAAKYVSDHFFNTLLSVAREKETVDEAVILTAFDITKRNLFYFADSEVAEMGSCVLVGVIWRGILFVATYGDSTAVMGRLDQRSGEIVAEQLIKDPDVHPSDPQIHILQGAIGKVFPKFTSEAARDKPDVLRREIQAGDEFIIFASNGLWEHLTNQEAVDIVRKNRRVSQGIARRLVVSALEKAANRKGKSYDDVKKMDANERREVHDDMSVIVVFIDLQPLLLQGDSTLRTSIRGGFIETAKISDDAFP